MQWTPKCPKCGSGAISIRPMNGGYRHSPEDVFLACVTCGKRLYGKSQIEETFQAQKKAWLKDPEAQAAAKRAEEEAAEAEKQAEETKQRAAHARRLYAINQERRAQQEAEAREAEHKAWLKRVEERQKLDAKLSKQPVQADENFGPCAFEPCENERRENSKYCSIQCKNKYARARYKARKEAKKAAQAAAK